jgi:hypothetical protein
MKQIRKNYKGKPVVLNLEKINYSVREISEITKHSVNHVTVILNECNLKPVGKEYCKTARQSVRVYNYKDLLIAFNQTILYPVIKKERKSCFEFAHQSFESKINKL